LATESRKKLRAVLDTNVPINALGGEHKGIEIVDGLTFLRRVRGEELTEGS
jgi:hypothetical protein